MVNVEGSFSTIHLSVFFHSQIKPPELNNNTAHRTHNNTVSWFIPLQSDSQTLTKLDEKTSKENRAHNIFTTRPVLAYSARTCSLPYLVALALIW